MHYCILLFTKSLPSDADIVTTMLPYSDENDLEGKKMFNWDSYTIGGRYAGLIRAEISSISHDKRLGKLISCFRPVNMTEVRSRLFDLMSELKDTYKALMYYEHDLYPYILEEDNTIKVDGAYIDKIHNNILDHGYGYITDKGECGYMASSAVKEVYRDYAERGGFITVLDLHD